MSLDERLRPVDAHDWIAVAAALAFTAAGLYMLLGPEGVICRSTATSALTCRHNDLIPYLGAWIVLIAAAIVAIGAGLYALRHVRLVALGTALLILAFVGVSFGVGVWLLPAALLLGASEASRRA